MRFSVWFEPERVSEGTWLYAHHPEWLLQEGHAPQWLDSKQKQVLLNLGNPDARRWLTDWISNAIDEDGIDIFRHDFNIDPLSFWQKADAPDRQGITEIRYIEGLYAFWDELLARHPNLLIDNCASGGRRIDLETTSRSVPLWRSDLFGNTLWRAGARPRAQPLGSAQFRRIIHSLLLPAESLRGAEHAELRHDHSLGRPQARSRSLARAEDYERSEGFFQVLLRRHLSADSPSTSDEKQWLAYQCDRPDLGEGMVMAFRRKEALRSRRG